MKRDVFSKVISVPKSFPLQLLLLSYDGLHLRVSALNTREKTHLCTKEMKDEKFSDRIFVARAKNSAQHLLLFIWSLKNNQIYTFSFENLSFRDFFKWPVSKFSLFHQTITAFYASSSSVCIGYSDKSVVEFTFNVFPSGNIEILEKRVIFKPVRELRSLLRKKRWIKILSSENTIFSIDNDLLLHFSSSNSSRKARRLLKSSDSKRILAQNLLFCDFFAQKSKIFAFLSFSGTDCFENLFLTWEIKRRSSNNINLKRFQSVSILHREAVIKAVRHRGDRFWIFYRFAFDSFVRFFEMDLNGKTQRVGVEKTSIEQIDKKLLDEKNSDSTTSVFSEKQSNRFIKNLKNLFPALVVTEALFVLETCLRSTFLPPLSDSNKFLRSVSSENVTISLIRESRFESIYKVLLMLCYYSNPSFGPFQFETLYQDFDRLSACVVFEDDKLSVLCKRKSLVGNILKSDSTIESKVWDVVDWFVWQYQTVLLCNTDLKKRNEKVMGNRLTVRNLLSLSSPSLHIEKNFSRLLANKLDNIDLEPSLNGFLRHLLITSDADPLEGLEISGFENSLEFTKFDLLSLGKMEIALKIRLFLEYLISHNTFLSFSSKQTLENCHHKFSLLLRSYKIYFTLSSECNTFRNLYHLLKRNDQLQILNLVKNEGTKVEWDDINAIHILRCVDSICTDVKRKAHLLNLLLKQNISRCKCTYFYEAKIYFIFGDFRKCNRTLTTLYNVFQSEWESLLRFSKDGFWTKIFYETKELNEKGGKARLFMALKALYYGEIDTKRPSAKGSSLILDIFLLSRETEKYFIAINIAFQYFKHSSFSTQAKSFFLYLRKHNQLKVLYKFLWRSNVYLTKIFEEIARKETATSFVTECWRNRKGSNLITVFGMYGVLIVNEWSREAKSKMCGYLWEVMDKILSEQTFPERILLKLATPVAKFLLHFVCTESIEFFKVPHFYGALAFEGAIDSVVVSESDIRKVLVLMICKYVLLRTGKECKVLLRNLALVNRTHVREASHLLLGNGYATLAFFLLDVFKEDLTDLFQCLAQKCHAIQRTSFVNSRNNSRLSIRNRLELGYDLGTTISRHSWSLLQNLLEKYDSEELKYTPKVIRSLLSRGDDEEVLFFLPSFLGPVSAKSALSLNSDDCFTKRRIAACLLGVLVENSYLVNAAEIAIYFCKNERLRYLKGVKTLWYPRKVVNQLLKKIEAHLKEKSETKLLESLELLYKNLKMELLMCDSVAITEYE